MARDDWFRNKTWSAEIEANFQQRLRRSRAKSQYLRIQAHYLVESHPTVALGLLDQYFSLEGELFMAQAYVEKARALVALGSLQEAVKSYEAALECERQFPQAKTQAYLDFVCFVLEAQMPSLYNRALNVLDTHGDRPVFPVERYRYNGARALLLQQLGRKQEARDAAATAMAAASETHSGFRYHQHLGLVQDTDSVFAKRVAALAEGD